MEESNRRTTLICKVFLTALNTVAVVRQNHCLSNIFCQTRLHPHSISRFLGSRQKKKYFELQNFSSHCLKYINNVSELVFVPFVLFGITSIVSSQQKQKQKKVFYTIKNRLFIIVVKTDRKNISNCGIFLLNLRETCSDAFIFKFHFFEV